VVEGKSFGTLLKIPVSLGRINTGVLESFQGTLPFHDVCDSNESGRKLVRQGFEVLLGGVLPNY
jgi:hypothetical protein